MIQLKNQKPQIPILTWTQMRLQNRLKMKYKKAKREVKVVEQCFTLALDYLLLWLQHYCYGQQKESNESHDNIYSLFEWRLDKHNCIGQIYMLEFKNLLLILIDQNGVKLTRGWGDSGFLMEAYIGGQ